MGTPVRRGAGADGGDGADAGVGDGGSTDAGVGDGGGAEAGVGDGGGHAAAAAATVALTAFTVFVALAWFMAVRGGPLPVDDTLLNWSVAHRPAVATALARGLTATGTGVTPYALLVVAGVAVGRSARQRLLAAVLGTGCLGAAQAVRYATMALVERPRPPRLDWQTHGTGWAFPSGHTTTAAITAGLLVLAVLLAAPHGRGLLMAVIGCWGVLVGLTRIYLAVHWCSDVIGGWLFAAGWLGLVLWAAGRWLPAPLRRRVRAVA
ncbi:phosphatase PAP2 family protein [Streptomyces odontomachi]|uniref:phosphatase PAP2 family protein n=1 Tax=Streptomyces odontomachi TaxID=2944940 RepID=UPI0035A841ED